MAIRATGGFNILRYEPGNPEFPTLPDGVIVPHFIDLSRVAGFRAATITKPRVFASAPGNDRQRFAGWQTETTWVNPTVIDFGVITSPIRTTVSLYNARFTSVDVTALNFGTTGVTLISPALPQTLDPYSGVTFTIEAGTTGPDSFDELVTFTTSEGPMLFRVIGRRVFSLNVVPQRPIKEALRFKTDLIRSDDGSEKAYRLLRTPDSAVDYRVRFTDDLARIRIRNDFIAGESALVVGAQKWWEQVSPVFAIETTDLSIAVPYPIEASWWAGGPISVVSQDAQTVAQATVETITLGPDPYVEQVVVLARFDGPDGSTDATNLIDGTPWTMLFGTQIDEAQSVFGGSSLLCSPQNPGFALGGAYLPYNANMDAPTDMTFDLWFRPTATDISSSNVLASRWHSSDPGARSWILQIISAGASIRWTQREGGTTRNYDFAIGSTLTADTWYYLRVSKIDGTIRMGLDGSEIGTGQAQVANPNEGDIRFIVGDYYDSGYTQEFKGHIDDVRFTAGVGRDVNEAAPTGPHPGAAETYTLLNFSTEIGTAFDTRARVMPVGLGYISQFPTWNTYPVNAEDISYTMVMNQEPDLAELPADWPLLDGIPILEFCNELEGSKQSKLDRYEDVLDSGLSNRIAFSKYPFSDISSDFRVTLQTRADIWRWRKWLHYMAGSWLEMYVPTFRQDFPNVTTTASNVFNMDDTDYAVLFGTTPPKRRDALRFEYDDGTILYRTITSVVDNGATEQFTVSSAVLAGTPKISYMNLSRILADSATFDWTDTNNAVLTFRYRTIQR